MAMITSLAWVPKGAARARPLRYEISPEEYKRVKAVAKLEQGELAEEDADDAEDADDDDDDDGEDGDENGVDRARAAAVDTSLLPAEFNMDKYDLDDDEGEMEDDNGDFAGDDDENPEEFAFLEQGGSALAIEKELDEADEDDEDDEIRPTDSLICVAMTEDEFSHLEVQLFSEDGNLYVHHDITLPDFPLCLAWMDCPPFLGSGGTQQEIGNYMAVGTFSPGIEIWNLDVLDPLEPSAVLGGVDEKAAASSKKKKSSKKKMDEGPQLVMNSHAAAVMSLSWNSSYRQALASGSADNTVKIWDVTTQQCSHTFTHHSDKVQSVCWNQKEAWLLASGAFDKKICITDCRSPAQAPPSYTVSSDVEAIQWDPHNSYNVYCSLENGEIVCIDTRAGGVMRSFMAHDTTTSSLSFSSRVPGMLATASVDKFVKVWDVSEWQAETPRMVAYKSMMVGKLFALNYNNDEPFLLAAAGDRGQVAVWESDEQDAINSYFSGRVLPPLPTYNTLTQSLSEPSSSGTVAVAAATFPSASAGAGALSLEDEDDSWMESTGPAVKMGDKKSKSKKSKKSKK